MRKYKFKGTYDRRSGNCNLSGDIFLRFTLPFIRNPRQKRRLDYRPLFEKMSPHSDPGDGGNRAYQNPDFQKRSPEWRFLKTLAYRLRVDGRKRWTNSILGLTPRCEPGPHWLETSALTNAPVPFAPLASLATTRFPKKLGQTVSQNSATVLFDKTPTQFQTQARNGQCNA